MKTTEDMPFTTPEDMLMCRMWATRYFSNAADLPITFVLDGQAIHGIPEAWQPVVNRRRVDANIVETVFEGTDQRDGLECPGRVHGVPGLSGDGMGGLAYQPGP